MLEPLISALVGALIGGLCSFGAVYWQNRQADLVDARARRREVEGFLRAAVTELRVLDDKFDVSVGRMLDLVPEGEPFRASYTLSQDYFTVFGGNAGLIGCIEDDALRDLIVRTYTSAKSIVDALRLNSTMYERLITAEVAAAAGVDGAAAQVSQMRAYMIEFVRVVRAEDEVQKALLARMAADVDAYVTRSRAR